MNVRPIPLNMLKNNASYLTNEIKNSFSETISYDEYILNNINIVINKKYKPGIDHYNNYEYILFYDIVNSKCINEDNKKINVEFKLESKINYKNKSFTIKDIKELEAFGKIHHIELGLM